MTQTAELQMAVTLETIPELAQRAVDLAWSRDARLAVAESCTAGAVPPGYRLDSPSTVTIATSASLRGWSRASGRRRQSCP